MIVEACLSLQYSMMRMQDTNGILHPFAIFEVQNSGAAVFVWPDGKKHARNVYAHTREECEEKLKVLIVEMKAELAELKRQKAEGSLPP